MESAGLHRPDTASTIPLSTIGDHNIAKFGVAALSETLRQELEPINIGVSVLCPGVVRSGLNQRAAAIFSRASAVVNPVEIVAMNQVDSYIRKANN